MAHVIILIFCGDTNITARILFILTIVVITNNYNYFLEHIGYECEMSNSGYSNERLKLQLLQYVVSLSKALNLHWFSRLSCEMIIRLEHP